MATKPDLNTHPTSTEFDELPGSLGERQARSYRRDPSVWRGTAIAVIGTDGEPLELSTNDLLTLVLYELRALRTAMVIKGTAADLDDGVEANV